MKHHDHEEEQIPSQFICPISRNIMQEPTLILEGHCFQRECLKDWFRTKTIKNPMTNLPITNIMLIPNRQLKTQIRNFLNNPSPQYIQSIDFSKFQQNSFMKKKLTMDMQIYGQGDCYYGQMSKGKRSGNGIEYIDYKMVYKGEWRDDKYHGKGVLVIQNIYEGYFVEGQKCGYGQCYYEEQQKKLIYKGYWQRGKFHGKGRLIYKNGRKYEGQFVQGQRCGRGSFLSKGNNLIYNGEWMNDKKHGKGKYHCPDGSRYYGNFASDMRHGYGEYFFENKLVYSGEWKNDRKQGKGSLYTDNFDYEGQFIDDKFHGQGHLAQKGRKKIVYEGNFQNGYKQGFGKQLLNGNELIFIGYFYKGKREGLGREYKNGKQVFEGKYKNGRKMIESGQL